MSSASGINIVDQTEVTVGGYTGTRFDIKVRNELTPCPDNQIPLVDGVNPVDVDSGDGASVRTRKTLARPTRSTRPTRATNP